LRNKEASRLGICQMFAHGSNVEHQSSKWFADGIIFGIEKRNLTKR